MKNLLLFLLMLGIVSACSNDEETQSKILDIRVNHYKNTGIGEGLFLVLMTQEGDAIGTDTWNKFYTPIEGFNFVPGTIYDLVVQVETIKNPPADGSALKYTLKEIRSTEEVSSDIAFDIDLKINGQNFVTTSSGYELLNQLKIDCQNLCGELETALENQDFVVGTFKRLENSDLQLIAIN